MMCSAHLSGSCSSRRGFRENLNLNFIVIIRQFRDERCSCATFLSAKRGCNRRTYLDLSSQMHADGKAFPAYFSVEILKVFVWHAVIPVQLIPAQIFYAKRCFMDVWTKTNRVWKQPLQHKIVDFDYRMSLLQWPESFSITFQLA